MELRNIYINGAITFEDSDMIIGSMDHIDDALVTIDEIYCNDIIMNTDAKGVELRRVSDDSNEFDLHVDGNIHVTKDIYLNR